MIPKNYQIMLLSYYSYDNSIILCDDCLLIMYDNIF